MAGRVAKKNMELARFLKDRREDLDLSRPMVVLKAGHALSASYLEAIETKGSVPAARILAALAEAYDVDPLYLLVMAGHLSPATKAQKPLPVQKPPAKGVFVAGRNFDVTTPRNQKLLADMAELLAKQEREES